MTTLNVCDCCASVAENGGADGTAHGAGYCGTTHPRPENVGAVPCGLTRVAEDEWQLFCATECDACGAEMLFGAMMHEYSDEPAPMMTAPDRWDRAEFWDGYRSAMIWTALANEPEEFGSGADSLDHYVPNDSDAWDMVDAATRADVQREAYRFMRDIAETLTADEWQQYEDTTAGRGASVWSCAGHDFLLTRNGHGTGFWDRGAEEVGERLSKMAEDYGPRDMFGDLNGPICGDETELVDVYIDG